MPLAVFVLGPRPTPLPRLACIRSVHAHQQCGKDLLIWEALHVPPTVKALKRLRLLLATPQVQSMPNNSGTEVVARVGQSGMKLAHFAPQNNLQSNSL